MYPGFLVILFVMGNIREGMETTGKIYQFDVTENRQFY
jgi:hypothetical protein